MHWLQDKTHQAAVRRGLNKTPLQYLQDNLVVTTSGNWYEPAFVCTLLALGADSILWAIDWTYEANRVGMDFLRKLSLNKIDKEKIAYRNAEGLLKL
jgi:2,3-dihydroxybenzoate decarboxylase